MAQLLHFRVKAVFLAGHFVIVAFVFIHIPGGCFIFNISKGQLPVSDPEKHIHEPPQLAQAGLARVARSHALHGQAVLHTLGALHPPQGAPDAPTPCIGRRPFTSARGCWP